MFSYAAPAYVKTNVLLQDTAPHPKKIKITQTHSSTSLLEVDFGHSPPTQAAENDARHGGAGAMADSP